MNQIQKQNEIISNEILLSRLDEIKGALVCEYVYTENPQVKKEIEDLIGEIKNITDKVRIRGAKAVINLDDKIMFYNEK